MACRNDNPMPTWFLAPIAGLKNYRLRCFQCSDKRSLFKNINCGKCVRRRILKHVPDKRLKSVQFPEQVFRSCTAISETNKSFRVCYKICTVNLPCGKVLMKQKGRISESKTWRCGNLKKSAILIKNL